MKFKVINTKTNKLLLLNLRKTDGGIYTEKKKITSLHEMPKPGDTFKVYNKSPIVEPTEYLVKDYVTRISSK